MPTIKITGFIPKELINIDAVRLQLLNALRAEGREIRRDFWKTTRTWKHKPKFEMKVSLKRAVSEGSVEVFTDSEIYRWVNDGTKPHPMGPIRPRRPGGSLRIPTGGTRVKTTPGRLGSRRGGSKGPYVFAKSTKRFLHPGTRPRLFNVAITRRMERTKRFQKRIDAAIGKGLAKVSGEIIIK